MLDRRGFFGWLAGLAGLGAVKEVQAVQTSKEARPLFVLTLEKDYPLVTAEQFHEGWKKEFPAYDLVLLPEGSRLEIADVPFVQTIEQIDGHLLNIVAPDLVTYERLRELCVPKPQTIQYVPNGVELTREEVDRIIRNADSATINMNGIRAKWFEPNERMEL